MKKVFTTLAFVLAFVLSMTMITACADNSQISGVTGGHITTSIDFGNLHLTTIVFLIDFHIDCTADGTLVVTAAEYLINGTTAYECTGIACYVGCAFYSITSGKYAVKCSAMYGYISCGNSRCVSAAEQILYGVAAIVYNYSSRSRCNSGRISCQVTASIDGFKCIFRVGRRRIYCVNGYNN